ncbi:MAG: CotH kinase family protein [Sedimentisphaerales bacterium]|nr:CotH kinase family protein [Sedimentisphaerales bacterium]
MGKPERISFIGLLFLALSLAGLLTYYHKQLMQPVLEVKDPFRSDHVAKILIIMREEDWLGLKSNTRAEQYVRANFWFDGEPYRNVAIRPKGMSSLMSGRQSGRMPLKVDFNFFNFAQNFRGIKKLNLNNGFSDPSFIRETIGYELFEQMNLPTPRRAFADVWVNSHHLGLYTIVEQVDKTFLRRNFTNFEGNLYKPEQGPAALNWTKEDFDKNNTRGSQVAENQYNNLDIKIGGSRLGDLIKILKREGSLGSEMLPDDAATSTLGAGMPFPGGPGGGFPGPFPGDPNSPFPGGPGEGFPGPFLGDPNRPFPGGPGGRFPASFAADPNRPFPGMRRNRFPGEPNEPFAGGRFRAREGFPGGPPGPFPGDPNSPFAAGFRGRRGFPGDPNRPFGGGFRERGGFPGGPGGMFGRGGNLIELMGLKTNENYPDYRALFRFLEVLNKCPGETFPSEIEKVLDVDEVLRFLAVSVLIVHLDNYIGMGHNYYLYEDNGKFCVIPWDLNMAFGTFGMGPNRGGVGNVDLYIDEPTTGAFADRPLVARLFAHQPYLEKYHQYLKQLLNGGFAEGVIEARIDELAKMIRPYVEADEMKFFTNDDFESNVGEKISSGALGEFSNETGHGDMQARDTGPGGRGGRRGGPGGGMNAPKLRAFIKARRLSVTEQLDGKRPSQGDGDQNIRNFDMFERFRQDMEKRE